ncbi:hypothetical protein Ddc_11313 [Ditylenchus destructor]|nr:hypothetical protein Ddc_11313 [Ditylenchus destructor]
MATDSSPVDTSSDLAQILWMPKVRPPSALLIGEGGQKTHKGIPEERRSGMSLVPGRVPILEGIQAQEEKRRGSRGPT